ncbi:hypothetical protein J2Y39_000315 [Pseudomonas sp. 2957]|uniref:hypothetical protein n=1 Tax=Pseudomonas sp. 2957 TaxID=2817766 RepID=UPI0028638464|nr:hypothetical protein [Pseudomonas sp. 2957]MDR6945735.1 hypothetical protein [Pseudomonas sp. 2957]
MSQDDKLIDLSTERAKRVHDLNEKRLNEVRQAFEQAMPLGKPRKSRRTNRKSVDLPLHWLMQISYFPSFISLRCGY